MDQAFSDLQRPPLNVDVAMVRMRDMLMIRSGLGSLGASLVFWLYGDPY